MQSQRFLLIFSLLVMGTGCVLPGAPMCCPPCPPTACPPISPYGRFPGPVAPLPMMHRTLSPVAASSVLASPVPAQWSPPVRRFGQKVKSLWPVTRTYTSHHDPLVLNQLAKQCHCEKCRAKRKHFKAAHHKQTCHKSSCSVCDLCDGEGGIVEHCSQCQSCEPFRSHEQFHSCEAMSGCSFAQGGSPCDAGHCGSAGACGCDHCQGNGHPAAISSCAVPDGASCVAPSMPPDAVRDTAEPSDTAPLVPPPIRGYDDAPGRPQKSDPANDAPEPVPPPAPLPVPENDPGTDAATDLSASDAGNADEAATEEEPAAPPSSSAPVDSEDPVQESAVSPIGYRSADELDVPVMVIPSTVVERKRYQ